MLVKLLNIPAKLQDYPVTTQNFIFYTSELVNCKGALNIRESKFHFSRNRGCHLIKDLKFRIKIFC